MDPRELSLNNAKDCDSLSYRWHIQWRTLYKNLNEYKIIKWFKEICGYVKKKGVFQEKNTAYSKPMVDLWVIGGLLNVPKCKEKQEWILRKKRYCFYGHWKVVENSQ